MIIVTLISHISEIVHVVQNFHSLNNYISATYYMLSIYKIEIKRESHINFGLYNIKP